MKTKATGRFGSSRLKSFNWSEPGLHQQLHFVVDACSVSKAAKVRNGNRRNIRPYQNINSGTVKIHHILEAILHIALWERIKTGV
ncbi:hypothetical protein D3C76_1613070 [compost metagenome]